MIVLIIKLLKTYWKPLVGFAIAAFIWGHGNSVGKSAIRSQWNAEKLQMAMDIQAEKDRLQDEANKKSSELETALAGMRDKNRKLNRDLANEIKINRAAYDNCIVSPSVVQLWNTSTKAGDTK